MRRSAAWFAAAAALVVLVTSARAEQTVSGDRGSLTIVEAGRTADGSATRYNLEAHAVDIRDLLHALLRRNGGEFTIDQNVSGPVSLVLRDKSMDEIIDRVRALARPPIVIRRNGVTTVSLAPVTEGQAGGQQAPGAQASQVIAIPRGYAQALNNQMLSFGQPVTLNIPASRPIALREAVRLISQQTEVPIRLDSRVPADVGFSAQFSQTPLSLVLDSISRTAAFKWYAQPDGSLLIAPTDWVHLTLGNTAVAGYPSQPCTRCGKPMLRMWVFCPYDGQPLGRRGPTIRRGP